MCLMLNVSGVSRNLETGGGAGAAGTCACRRHATARGHAPPENFEI